MKNGRNGSRMPRAGFLGLAGITTPDAKTKAKFNVKVKLGYFNDNFNDNATLTIT
tara:strand:+ start:483 stop:647 length:165 start_codon:yes stop_codon:yes gene_type:complete